MFGSLRLVWAFFGRSYWRNCWDLLGFQWES
jgi:hypothetical protein